MLREARIQQALAAEGVPVPQILAVCADTAVLGVPFYVMEMLDGEVVTDTVPTALQPHQEDLATRAVDALAELHQVNISSGPLADLGRPDGYLERQVRRFGGLWPEVSTRELALVDELQAWLKRHLPQQQRSSVVHGDYRIGNLMFHREAPVRVHAILDWEMATLGDPLADLGYFCATYATPGAIPTPLELTPVTRQPGFATRSQLVDRYVQRTGADASALPWYQTLALFKAAVFCEAMYTRWLRGERPGDAFAASLATGVPTLLEAAREH